jgi:light-regulated signal transduction histidine kinase (bacteriophytochrome)
VSDAPHDAPVTLANCADEPIHIPGAIQSHGALFAFDAGGRLAAWSANAQALLGVAPSQGMAIDAMALPDAVRAFLAAAALPGGVERGVPLLLETTIGEREFDLVAHRHDGRLLAEFEHREIAASEVAAFAVKAHRGIDGLRRQASLDALLRVAVERIRELTGFDRVMAYRFRHDDSGDVVAESVRGDWPRFLGMRYPASDIPAQARRLYILNTLRLIADIGSTPVPLLGGEGTRPLDLSHAVLRSVSPIHIEYLRNMGVGASMSVSIVVNGRLWGLLACHHGGPKQVPYALRMACDVLAQILASGVQSMEAREHAVDADQAADVRSALVEAMLAEEDMLAALHAHAGALAHSLGAEALVAAQGGKLITHGGVPHAIAQAIVASLPADAGGDGLLQRTALADWPAELHGELGRWIGLLGLHFDPSNGGWLLALRPEQVETVRWGGKPEKTVEVGPLGARLTPRGSFEEWQEVVRGTAEPWDASRTAIARRLLGEMYRASNHRHGELERLRTQLLAMLGHDLRDPLQTITLAARVLEMGGGAETVGPRIQASSNRMQRLISHVLDLSRLQGGLGMQVRKKPTDVVALLLGLIEEWKTAHPGSPLRFDAPAALVTEIDPDRFMQVASNLVSNARHHGVPGHSIDVRLAPVGGVVRLEVRNLGQPIDDGTVAELFRPFKRSHGSNPTNRSGMGLGLYIAHEVVAAHGGRLAYAYEAPHVVFAADFPRQETLPDPGA